jgi:hypothetical protein
MMQLKCLNGCLQAAKSDQVVWHEDHVHIEVQTSMGIAQANKEKKTKGCK